MDTKINSAEVLYSKGGNDECWTPRYAVKPLLKYLKPDSVIWCPFDTKHSEFVRVFEEAGYKVLRSSIKTGQDFFDYEPSEPYDVIISNPPFTNKKLYFERCLQLNKPFALLMTLTWLNDSAPKKLFKDRDLQLLMFDRRIEFLSEHGEELDKKITFSSAYYCYDFLPKQIICENLFK